MDSGRNDGEHIPTQELESNPPLDQPNPPADPPVDSDNTATPQEPPAGGDEASRLEELQADVRNQDDLERDITRQADRLLVEQADERDNKRLERTRREKE